MGVIELLLTTGAAARLTRLTTRDQITAPLRHRLEERVLFDPAQRAARAAGRAMPGPRSQREAQARVWLHTLLGCDWCAGFWWSALVATAGHRWGHTGWWRLAATILTASHALGWLAEHESQPEPAQQAAV
jgi:hypothetical protein